ncbi:MAG: group II intron reverse transcriptase/maturase [Thermoanaerobaculia bacterium]
MLDPARSKNPSTHASILRGNREIPRPPVGRVLPAVKVKSKDEEPEMNGRGKSDSPVVPTKPSNKAARAAAERVEGRGLAKGNLPESGACRTQSRESATSALERVRQAAKRDRRQRFTALLHHVYDVECLMRAYRAMAHEAAAGVDGQTWHRYGQDGLEQKLRDLSERLKTGAYRVSPVRRVYIPKADGRRRPLGVPTLEDKLVQRATAEVLGAIYEEDFLGFSYGFRPKRSQHQALDALAVGIHSRKVNWVLDADIRSFFDTLDHGWMVKFLEHRVGDRRVVSLILRWLKAGVVEDGARRRSEEGTVQGGSISPLLSNVYLHYVFDLWVQRWRKTQIKGDVIVVRYADDFIVGFEHRADAERFLSELRERFLKFGLELHPEKTRLIEFGRFAAMSRRRKGLGKPETFNFLGFTHICGQSRGATFTVVRQTMRKQREAKLKAVTAELRRRYNASISETGAYLRAVLQGHYNYYGVPLNYRALRAFQWALGRIWKRALERRSQRARVRWERMSRLIDRWLPPARICHPFPFDRLNVKTQGKSRMR